MRRGTAGRLALGGLYGVNSAIHDIERDEEWKRQQAIQNYQVNARRRTVDDEISASSYKTNDNKYAWRLNCENGKAYGIYPENYETREAYHNVIRLLGKGRKRYHIWSKGRFFRKKSVRADI